MSTTYLIDDDPEHADWLHHGSGPKPERVYNPDQPRDDQGQWTSGGGNGEGSQQSGGGGKPAGASGSGGGGDGGSVSGAAGGVEPSGAAAAVSAEPLVGAPRKATIRGVGQVEVGPHMPARQAAADYMRKAGLNYNPPKTYAKVDKERAKRIADEYEKMPHAPDDPEVKEAYAAMASETVAQYQAVLDTGLNIEFIDFEKTGDPYAASPRMAIEDIKHNNHFWVFPTQAGFGSDAAFDPSDNPLLAKTDYEISGQPTTVNDLFRIVHDYFGHVKDGVGMRADGEENAWRSHSSMFSDKARRAMTTETRGQNSWVNFGPHAAENRYASGSETHYADQKVGLLPEWVTSEGAGDETDGAKDYNPSQPRDEGGRWTDGGGSSSSPSSSSTATAASAAIRGESKTPPPPGKTYEPDVEADDNGDGIADYARVGVPADSVPPPPQIPRLPRLTSHERKIEEEFATAYEKDPDGVAAKFREGILATTKEGDPPTFETDAAKRLHAAWEGKGLTPEERAENRATLNTPMHATANAIAKRAFVQHLDTLEPGERILVTVGGCGAGKGYALKQVPEALAMKSDASVVWDAAGDQNATENPWIQSLAEERGLKVDYVYVHADPHTQWGHPERGVIKRAGDPADGRMVDAKVFADSYVMGARNHEAFYEANRENPSANFVFLQNGNPVQKLDGIPREALKMSRKELMTFAINAVATSDTAPPRVKRGALAGQRIWIEE